MSTLSGTAVRPRPLAWIGLQAASLWVVLASTAAADAWPQWRGPAHDNHAAPGATAPTAWSDSDGLAWQTKVPGRGHSSPIVFGNRIYLTTCEEKTAVQSLVVFDRDDGALLKQTTAHEGAPLARIHPKNTYASSTAACDGQRVYAVFVSDGAVWATAFDLAGERLWQTRIADYMPQRYEFGFGSSPIVVDGVVVVAGEYDGAGSGVYGLSAADGQPLWSVPRPRHLSFSTPVPASLSGQTQLLLCGNKRIVAFQPSTGREIWSIAGSTAATCGTMVWDPAAGLAFASGGYPDSFTMAVRTAGDHGVAWRNNVKCYEQSLLLVDGYLYAAADNGVAYCWRAADGEQMWKQRLRGPFSASPLAVGRTIYVSNEAGTTYVFSADPERFKLIAQNTLGDDCFTTAAPCDGRLYLRYALNVGGRRQEYLAAIGN